MHSKFEDLLRESDLACAVLFGTSVAAAIVLGVAAVVAGIAALAVSVWWALGSVLFGLLSGAAVGLSIYIYDYSF